MSFPRYESYKDSGVEWLGEVPSHWPVQPLKTIATFTNGEAFKPGDWSDTGTPIIRIQNLNGGDDFNFFKGEIGTRYHIRTGDLLYGWSGNRGTSFGPFKWARQGLHYLNQHIFKVDTGNANLNWLYRCLKAVTAYVEQEAHGIIGMVHVTQGRLGAIGVPLPPQPDQAAIAAFLDRETAKIDALVEAQRRLIELLKEKRQAVISHAITKGLDPSAPTKDSGVEWLGEVPAHWAVLPLGRVVERIEQGWSPSAHERPPESGEASVLRLSAIKDGRFQPDERKALPELDSEDLARAPLVRAGDFFVTRANTPDLVGDCAIATDVVDTIFSDLIYRISFSPTALSDFMLLMLRSSALRWQVRRDARGSSMSMAKLSHRHIKSWSIVIPPADEQRSIIDEVQEEVSGLERLTKEAKGAIELLQERRAALISAAVTGKIDVRGLAAAPEEAQAA